MIRITLATSSVAFEQRVRRTFDNTLNGDLNHFRHDLMDGDLHAAVREIAGERPDVVALGPGLPVHTAMEYARVFDREHPEISVLVVAEPSPSLWEQALRAGVRDVIAPDASDLEVRRAFDRALETAARRRVNLVGEPESSDPSGRIITVLSPKGGSGKTTVASNLAVGLAQAEPGNVAIVDLDLQFGDVGSALQLVPEHTMADAARAGAGLDGTTLKVFLTPHPAQLYALCAPASPAEGEEISAEKVAGVIRLLAREFSYVVVDTSAGLDEHTLAALEVSTDLVLLCSMDVPSVRGLRKEVEALDNLGMVHQTRHFVLNRADSRVGMDSGDIAATVGLHVNVEVPSSRLVPLALNQGSPVLESDPRSPVARQLRELVALFADVPTAAKGGRRSRRKR